MGKILRRACEYCGVEFEPTRDDQKYHLPACRYRAYVERHTVPKMAEQLAEHQRRIEALEERNG